MGDRLERVGRREATSAQVVRVSLPRKVPAVLRPHAITGVLGGQSPTYTSAKQHFVITPKIQLNSDNSYSLALHSIPNAAQII